MLSFSRHVINVTFFQRTHLHLFDLTETPSDSDPKKKKKKRDDDPDRKKKKKDKKKKKVRWFMEAPVNQTVFFYESSCDAERKPSKTLLTQSTLNPKPCLETFDLH